MTDESGNGIPVAVREHLDEILDSPGTLLAGLKGVRGVSHSTAENLTSHFGSIRNIYQQIGQNSSEDGMKITIRMTGTVNGKRAISKNAVENILVWLRSEGFLPPGNSGVSNPPTVRH